MKAAVLNQIGDTALELRDDVTTTDVDPREVRVRVRATGVCHSDVSAMDGTLPALAPGIIGHEGAGEIVETGSQVTSLQPGDHVALTFVPPCGDRASCVRGQPHLCLVHTIAALVACGVMTGVGAVVNTARVAPGSTVLVTARHFGATVVVVGAGRGDAMVQFSAQELFLHDKRLLGSFYGGANVRRDYPRLIALWRAGRLDLDGMISKRITLDEINDGLRALKDGTNVIRQIVTF